MILQPRTSTVQRTNLDSNRVVRRGERITVQDEWVIELSAAVDDGEETYLGFGLR